MTSATIDSLQELLSATTIAKENKLSFAGKGLKLDTEDDAKDIEREIFEFEDLEVLCLEGNTIGIDAAKAIARGLKKHPEFKRALWSDIFTGRLKTEIPPALKYFSGAMMTCGVKLVELDLSDNAFGPNGIEGVKDLLKSDTCYTLEVLKLNNNGLGTFGGKILATCLMECYDSSCKSGTPLGLKVFVSGRGRLENEGAKCLAAVFKKMGTLEHVAMPQNGIQYPGIIELSDAFAHCKNLMHLNLNDNTFTVEGARAMAKALPKLQSLQILNFGDCLIRTEGAVLLSQALKDGHEVLREVILCGNEIKKEGGVSVASILCNKKSLQKVELGANNFGEDGVNDIKSLFKAHKLDAVLDSLDDDEGSDLDEEEDEDDDSDQESEEDDVQVVEADTANIAEDPLVSVSNFLLEPSAVKLMKLGPSRADKFVTEVKSYDCVEKGVHLLMKICSVVTDDDEDCKQSAKECADAVLSELLNVTHKKANERQSNTVNEILVQMGLIKNEEKKKITVNLVGVLIIVEHVYRQSYFPGTSRKILKTFLSKPDSNLHNCGVTVHRLMNTLHQY